MKLQLPTVTLMCVDCVDAEIAAKVLDICQHHADFGAVKLLTHQDVDDYRKVEITPLKTLVQYSVFMLTRAHEYIDTDHVLIVQRDGFILNPDAFDPEWLTLDYVAPLFMQVDKVGSGGFSLRSKRIMEYAAGVFGKWDGTYEDAERIQAKAGMYEDGVLSMGHQFRGFRVASLDQGAQFGQGGNRNPAYFRSIPFGFHRTWQRIDFLTGYVDSTDTTSDITPGYDNDIIGLHHALFGKD